MRTIFRAALLAAAILTGSWAYGASGEPIGVVKTVSGEVVVSRNGHAIKAEPNLKLQEGDVVQTGPNGKAGLILADDTVISLGMDSRVVLKSFQFEPDQKKMSLIARLLHGTASFLSGQLAKLAPKQVHIETPNATVGVRGTHVLVKVD